MKVLSICGMPNMCSTFAGASILTIYSPTVTPVLRNMQAGHRICTTIQARSMDQQQEVCHPGPGTCKTQESRQHLHSPLFRVYFSHPTPLILHNMCCLGTTCPHLQPSMCCYWCTPMTPPLACRCTACTVFGVRVHAVMRVRVHAALRLRLRLHRLCRRCTH